MIVAHRKLLGLLALIAGVLGVVGCGVTVTHTLNQASAEKQISESLAAKYDIPLPVVSCPSGVQATSGRRFDCRTSLDGQPLVLHATLTDGNGQFTIALGAVVFRSSTAVRAFAASVQTRTRRPTSVSCGKRTVLVEQPEKPFHCRATQDGKIRSLTVTVTDMHGHVRWVLGPPRTV